MKNITDQLDFDFSRPIDIQRNIDADFLNDCIYNFFHQNHDKIFLKHLRILIIELYICWKESDSQFLSVSMSKRGYNSKSRYNPNGVSSYLIKIINFLKKNNFIELYPGFYDAKTKKSRLTRVRPSNSLKNYFKKIKLTGKINFNHMKKEYLFIYKNGILHEYEDSYETQETREILRYYNRLISKTFFDIPSYQPDILLRGDNRKIIISHFISSTYSLNKDVSNNALFGGCWWNKIDLNLLLKIKGGLAINNKTTSYFDLLEFFGDFFVFKFKNSINLKSKIFSRVLNYDQLCYLIMKSFRSKNTKSFFKSVSNEKKKLSLEGFSSNEINEAITNCILNNHRLSNFIYKGINVGWEEFVSQFFYNLIDRLKHLDVPIYLVRDKVYFPSNKESVVSSKIEEILFKQLGVKVTSVNCKKSISFDNQKKGLFSRFTKSDINFSKRYLENMKYFNTG